MPHGNTRQDYERYLTVLDDKLMDARSISTEPPSRGLEIQAAFEVAIIAIRERMFRLGWSDNCAECGAPTNDVEPIGVATDAQGEHRACTRCEWVGSRVTDGV
jgi:hypothetical protein